MKIRNTLISLFLIVMTSSNYAQSAAELLTALDDLLAMAKDKEATVQIILTNKSGKEKIKEAMMFEKGKETKLYRYTKPESQAGIATLSLPGGVMWLYMPAFGKATKISLLSKSQAFNGTDFSYEDMNYATYSSLYTPSMADENHPEYYILKLLPKSKESEYSSILLYLNKTDHYPLKMEYFNARDQKFKEATYKYLRKDGYWYAAEVLMKDLKKEHSTKIIMTDIKFDQGLDDSLFTVENLKLTDSDSKD
jgi:outer membrane lipoprotein-sorting protein